MSQTITFTGATRAMGKLERAFSLGRSVDQPGIVTAAHTATWHMAGMIEHLRTLHDDCVDAVRRGELTPAPVRPAGSEETTT
jgi:hypothetical protein